MHLTFQNDQKMQACKHYEKLSSWKSYHCVTKCVISSWFSIKLHIFPKNTMILFWNVTLKIHEVPL